MKLIKKYLIVFAVVPFVLFAQNESANRVELFLLNLIEISKDQFIVGLEPEQIDYSQIVKLWAKRINVTEKQANDEIDQWIATVEKNKEDYFHRGLVAFYKKEFVNAANLLNKSAEEKSKKLTELKEQDKLQDKESLKLLIRGVRDIRLVGHALYHAYDFNNALLAYQQAIQYVPKDLAPELWAATMFDIGQLFSEVGTKVKENKEKILKNAVHAFDAALEVYNVEKFPIQWAGTQSRMGTILAIWGLNTDESNSDSLISAGIETIKKSLQVYTFDADPQQWAKTKNNIGATLSELALRKSGDEGKALMQEAVIAYKEALKVRTRDTSEFAWAKMHNHLAEAYYYLEDWKNVADSYANVLQVFPDNEIAYKSAADLYQKVVFNFGTAFELNKNWLDKHPNDLMEKVKFVEKYFTTGKYLECEKQIEQYRDNKDFSTLVQIIMKIFDIANDLALKKSGRVLAKLDDLILAVRDQRGDFTLNFKFSGLIYYSKNTNNLSPYQNWLVRFFEAVSKVDRDKIVAELTTVKNEFAPVGN